MINLLPPETKQSILFARRNQLLVQWLVAVVVGVLGILLIISTGKIYIIHLTNTYSKIVTQEQQQLASQKLDETKKQIEDISNSTKLVSQVLNREVLFSKLLTGIGAAMPPGASLQNLSIGKLDGGIDLQAVATDYQTATQVQVNLQDSKNKIFDKADIVNITCTTAVTAQNKYPCQVSIRATFAKNSPYVFANTTGVKQ
jgi:Tfp pilus assembly protein PilN